MELFRRNTNVDVLTSSGFFFTLLEKPLNLQTSLLRLSSIFPRRRMYIAGKTPAFPLNLIKRRLLPRRRVERARRVAPGVEREKCARGGHGRPLSDRNEAEPRRCALHRGIRRADGKRRMLDNHDETSRKESEDTQTALGTNGQVLPPKIPEILFSTERLSAEWFC